MIIKALPIKQNGFQFYLSSVKAEFLHNVCSTTINDLNSESGDVYQRKLNKSRVEAISNFAQRSRAIFPTAVVLNSASKLIYNDETMELSLPEQPNSFFIIDGQHRIEGLYKSNKDYELCVVVMDCVDIDLQSELFITINSEQKAVNPNVRFNIKSNDKYTTPEKMIRNIAELLNDDLLSPLYKKIWMDDASRNRGELPLSLSAFCSPLCAYIYNSNNYYVLKDELYQNGGNTLKLDKDNKMSSKYFLWPFYKNVNDKLLYKILLNYFSAIKNVYYKVWDDPKSSIIKTTGYNAFMILFKGLFIYCKANNNDFSYKFIRSILLGSKIDDSNFYSPKLGRSGAYDLYKLLKPAYFDDYEIDNDFMFSLSEEESEYLL